MGKQTEQGGREWVYGMLRLVKMLFLDKVFFSLC